MSDVTQILNAIAKGNQQAIQELFPVVYDELRKMASQQMTHEKPGQTLQPTALVHEAFLRMVGSTQEAMANRHYFFAASAEAMRRILVERARARLTQKRLGRRIPIDLDLATGIAESSHDQVLDVDAALERLAMVEPQAAELVKLRYFAGFTVEEASEILRVSIRSTHRLWSFAKAWLYDELEDSEQ